MKRIIAILTFGLFSLFASAQPGPGCCNRGGWGAGAPYSQKYEASTEQTISGEVTAMAYQTPMRGMSKGLHLTVKDNSNSYDVHLGPQWFLDRQDTSFKLGDSVVVIGSKVSMANGYAIIARQVSKGDMVITLRDTSGRPIWAGWRGRGKGNRP